VDLNLNFASLADDALAEYATEVRAAFDALAELDTPTAAQVDEAEALADHLDAIMTVQQEREEGAAALSERAAALRNRFKKVEEEEDSGTEPPPGDDEEDEEDDAPPEPSGVVEGEVVEVVDEPKVAARGTVATLARKVARPVKPAPTRTPVVITAAADVPDFATGSKIETLNRVGDAVLNRMRGFGTPSGDGSIENLQHYGVASFRLDFPEELTIDRHSDDMEVLTYAAKEHRLPGGSLTAAGGWCAPSETIYDLCADETAEGLVSLPEVNVKRGGIKYTSGPSFDSIYTATGFCQTEAQAIAGTAKTCVEVPCPSFQEVRLDVCGLCVKVPILTNAAYPELVQRWLSGSMIAHQHKMNVKVINSMVGHAGAARSFAGLGSTTGDTLEAISLIVAQTRQKYRLSMNNSVEVVVPHWVKDALRVDLARRNCCDTVSDAQIAAVFAASSANVQYVYDWQDLDVTAEVFPDTFDALVYPAGTFIKGTADVINLNAVYDAASLAVNIYTALFFEQGILVAKMCYEPSLITVPICNAGRTGAMDLTCAATTP